MQTAMTGRAVQQARWLLWQTGGVTVDGGERLREPENAAPQEMSVGLPISRSRYDAVIRRMQQAGQRTGTYTAWTQPSTMQPTSGSP